MQKFNNVDFETSISGTTKRRYGFYCPCYIFIHWNAGNEMCDMTKELTGEMILAVDSTAAPLGVDWVQSWAPISIEDIAQKFSYSILNIRFCSEISCMCLFFWDYIRNKAFVVPFCPLTREIGAWYCTLRILIHSSHSAANLQSYRLLSLVIATVIIDLQISFPSLF